MNNSSVDKINKLFELGVSRRKFLATAGAAGAATVIAGCSDNGSPAATTTATSTAYTDTDILNFALNLEYLEAEFYLYAATGSGLLAADAGSGAGTTTGGAKVSGTLSPVQTQFINELAYTEQQHVRALRGALTTAAVARPNINLTTGFAGAVTAANTLTSTLPAIPTTFSPTASYDSFLVGAYVFEDVGVTAYNGAGPLLTAASVANGTLGTAAGIMAVEAYHGGAIRVQLTANAINNAAGANPTGGYPYPAYANRLSLLRAALGGGNESQMTGFSPTTATTLAVVGSTTLAMSPNSYSTVVPANANALAYARTTDQVLHIVYGTFSPVAGSTTPAAGVTAGGFFPNGMNGNIKITLS